MSIQSSANEIENLEMIGRFISGIGLALIIMKTGLNNSLSTKDYIIGSLSALFMGVIVSFILQSLIVKTIVWSASDEDKVKALLVSQASNTIVPFYADKDHTGDQNNERAIDEEQGSETNTDPNHFKKKQYYINANKCSQADQFEHVDTRIGKALFPYHTMNTPLNEEKLKSSILEFQKCMIDQDQEFLDEKVYGPINKELMEFYSKYSDEKVEFIAQWTVVRIELKQGKISSETANKRFARLEQNWDRKVKAVFGKNSNVTPYLNVEGFFNNPDVKKYIFKATNQNVYYKPNDPKLKQEYMQKLPEIIFASYDHQRHLIKELDVKHHSGYVTPIEYKEQAKEAYKAIIIPMVVLFFSILFLCLNLVSLVSLLFIRIPVISDFVMAIGLIVILGFPLIQKSDSPNDLYMIKFVSTYQNIITKLSKD